jgi:hypothetical protein
MHLCPYREEMDLAGGRGTGGGDVERVNVLAIANRLALLSSLLPCRIASHQLESLCAFFLSI